MFKRWLMAAMLIATHAAAWSEPAGARIYAERCIACHQAGGAGVPGIAPPLAGNVGRMAGSEEGRAYLARVLLVGMVGAIKVDGIRYSGNMPAQAALTDAEIADVLGYLLKDIELLSDLSWLTPGHVASQRRAGGTPNDVHKMRARISGLGQ